MTLRIAQSSIENAGNGLFATTDMVDGQTLGRMYGVVLHKGQEGECVKWALQRRGKYNVLLAFDTGKDTQYAIVDAFGTSFGLINHSSDAPNVHVHPNGVVELCADVEEGQELLWDYGPLYGFGERDGQ
ncbi:MAG: SET domain-containing protein [Candidatus Thermoplasmatota archaeon]|nr:SET domain-containing protein [Candidatus Thermoplasmatota archaeon]